MLSVVLLGLLACTQAFHLKKIRSHNPQLDNTVVNLRRAAAKFGALERSGKDNILRLIFCLLVKMCFLNCKPLSINCLYRDLL